MSTTSSVTVELPTSFVDNTETQSEIHNRSIPEQIRYWVKLGKIAEENPYLPITFIKGVLIGLEEAKEGKVIPYEPYPLDDEIEQECYISLNKELIPDFLNRGQTALNKKKQPSLESLTKKEYIIAWFSFYNEGIDSDVDEMVKIFMSFDIADIKTAFEWSVSHWSELGLGEACKWIPVTEHVLDAMKDKKWGKKEERNLLVRYLFFNHWFLEATGN